ncbi:hypothetical protein [Clostridium diolis]|uniref:hypothetical protein n=1 Tax=Clostridium diolis TaxID=223919 RepID=UPI003AF68512
MTLSRFLKWILIIVISIIIVFSLGLFLGKNSILGYLIGGIWIYVIYFIILRYKLVSREEFYKLRKSEKIGDDI